MAKGNSWRHFKALGRKNFIVYKRSPLCAVLELLIPIGVMAFMCWIRSIVPIKKTDLVTLQKYKHPLFPALHYERDAWKWDPDWISAFEQDFM